MALELFTHANTLKGIMNMLERGNFEGAKKALEVHRGLAFEENSELRKLFALIQEYALSIDLALKSLDEPYNETVRQNALSRVHNAFQKVHQIGLYIRSIDAVERKLE